MAGVWRRPLVVVAAVAAVAGALVFVAPGARAADVAPIGFVVNSPEGFIGCVYNDYDPTGNYFWVAYCLVAQVQTTGPETGRLTLNSWLCSYPQRAVYDPRTQVLPRSALQVGSDGSFSFTGSNVPGMGKVRIAGSGNWVHEPAATAGDTVMFDPGYLGFRLVSPTAGLTLYHNWEVPPLDTPELIWASVGGVSQAHLIGAVWSSSTTGQWDSPFC